MMRPYNFLCVISILSPPGAHFIFSRHLRVACSLDAHAKSNIKYTANIYWQAQSMNRYYPLLYGWVLAQYILPANMLIPAESASSQ